MQICFNSGNDKEYQAKLNRLLKNIFLDFQFWYDLDLWDDQYESYSIQEDGEIVSNICVYRMKVLFDKKPYTALSFGAVATKDEYRGRGYSKILMEHILDKYKDYPMYLAANDSVLNFYPRFGFERFTEKLPVCDRKINNQCKAVKLSFDDPKVRNYVSKRVNFSDKLDCLNSYSINLFHIYWGYLKDHMYEIPELETMVIAEQNDTTLKLIGVFSLREIGFAELEKALPFSNVDRIEFGFMPYWKDIDYRMEEYDTDPLFVRNIHCNLGDIKFPELSFT